MNRDEVRDVFDEYVFGFIFSDIQREIDLAHHGEGGGNVLAALGLLCYTEFMGGMKRGIIGDGESRKNFEAFFARLGPAYEAFGKTEDVYDTFRCGLVHEYAVKRDCVVYMTKRGLPGIGRLPDGRYYFVVEQCFEDFKVAAQALYAEMLARPDPALPKRVVKKRRRRRTT